MKRIDYTGVFKGDVKTVFSLFTDEAFLSEYAVENGATSHAVSVEQVADRTSARLDWTVLTEGIPGFLRALVGYTIEMMQFMTWWEGDDGAYQGEISLDIDATREARLRGRTVLRPDGANTLFSLVGEITVSMPLIGARVEGMASDLVKDALEEYTKLGNRWLERGHEGRTVR